MAGLWIVWIGLASLLLVPGCINYGLIIGYRGWVRYISPLVSVGLPILTLLYIYFRQQAFAELTVKTQSYDYHEDAAGAMLLFLAAPVLVSGTVSSLIAVLVLWHRKRKSGTR